MSLSEQLDHEISGLQLSGEQRQHLESLIMRRLESTEAEVEEGIDRALGLVPALIRAPVRRLLSR